MVSSSSMFHYVHAVSLFSSSTFSLLNVKLLDYVRVATKLRKYDGFQWRKLCLGYYMMPFGQFAEGNLKTKSSSQANTFPQYLK